MESINIEKYVSIEPRAMHWVEHCVCLLEIFKKATRKVKKKKKKCICFSVQLLRDSKPASHENPSLCKPGVFFFFFLFFCLFFF